MRPIQYASNTSFDTTADTQARPRGSWASRTASNALSAVFVATGTFTIFWLIANVTALLMVRG